MGCGSSVHASEQEQGRRVVRTPDDMLSVVSLRIITTVE